MSKVAFPLSDDLNLSSGNERAHAIVGAVNDDDKTNQDCFTML